MKSVSIADGGAGLPHGGISSMEVKDIVGPYQFGMADAQTFADLVSLGFTFTDAQAIAEALQLTVNFSDSQAFTEVITPTISVAESQPLDDIFSAAISLFPTDSQAFTETEQLTLQPVSEPLTFSEVRQVTLRSFATGCTSNDTSTGNTVAPGNANGQNDGVFCNCTTGTATPDLINPVTVTSGSMNFPGGLTVISALVRVWFKVPAMTLVAADGPLTIKATSSGGYTGTVWTGPATGASYAGEDYSTTPLSKTLDVSALSIAQLQAMVLTASYTAAVVATPQTSIKVDAWSIDAVVAF